MFNWFRRWLFNRRRAIFQFWNGRAWCQVDPLVVFRKLREHPEFDLDRDTMFHEAGHEDSTQLCIAATRVAFGVTAFDGSAGLTEAETMDLLQSFGAWMQSVKKNTSPQPISLATSATVPPSCTASSTAATNNSAACDSMTDVPDSVAPLL